MVETLVELMSQQSEKLEAFALLQQGLQKAIVARDWDDLESSMDRLNEFSSELELIESERIRWAREITGSLGLPDSTPVSELRVHLSKADSRQLMRAQRGLEISIMKVRGVTGGIDAYLAGAVRMNRDVLNQLFPDQRGTMYSRRGQRAQADNRAIVVDRKL